MTRKQVISQAAAVLARRNIEESRLEAEVLLRHLLGLSRVQLYQDLDQELDLKAVAEFARLVERRLNGEPVAYITGHREFYGLDFHVDPRVLIPRPETELLVERALDLARKRQISSIADIGTGSGAIAVSLALKLPRVKIYATDVSEPALMVARLNCRRHGVAGRVQLLKGDLLDPLRMPVDLIIANLPYVTASELSRKSPGSFEPELALNGGPDGLEKIRKLSLSLSEKLKPGGSLLLEIGAGQSRDVTGFLRGVFPAAEIELTPDLAGISRVLGLTLPAQV